MVSNRAGTTAKVFWLLYLIFLLTPMTKPDLLIVGGGLIGCSIAHRLASEKLTVIIVERSDPGCEASWAAAGMLAPTSEHAEHPALQELAAAGAAMYPKWLARLGQRAADEVGYSTEGTLAVAFTEAEAKALVGLNSEPLTPAEARRLEPELSDRIVAARLLPRDLQIDNRRLVAAVLTAAQRAGVEVRPQTAVADIVIEAGRARGVRLVDGTLLEAGAVVNAAGCWSNQFGGESARYAPVRPVRGQMLALRRPESSGLRHVVRSPRAYLVPRGDKLVLGSTMEDAGYDKSLTPAGLRGLLAGGIEIAPVVASLPFADAWAGLRPDTPDHLPILGATDIAGYFVATGHFRNGILLAPITAEVMADVILGRSPAVPLDPFSPLRFASEH